MGNPLSRFLGLIRNPSYSRTTTLLVILTIALSIPLTVFVAQKQQELRQQAAFDPGTGGVVGANQCEQRGGDCKVGGCGSLGVLPGGGDCGRGTYGVSCCNRDPKLSDSQTSTKPVCTGVCTGVQTCQQVEGGRVDTSMTCSAPGTACCVVAPAASDLCVKTCEGGKVVAKGPTASCSKLPDPDCSITTAACTDSCTFKTLEECRTNPDRICAPSSGSCAGSPFPSGTCLKVTWKTTTTTSCDPNNQNDGWTYQCGVSAGCAAGQHKSICSRNPGQDTRCHSDSLFVGNNPCAGAGGPPASSAPSAPSTVTTTCSAPPTDNLLNACASPIKGTAPCDGKDPVCSPNQAVKRQSDASWYCFNSSTGSFVSYATCPASQPVGTQLAFTIGLSGLGNTGDSQTNFSNASGSNKNPRKNSRKLFYQVFDQSINQVKEGEGSVTFDSSSGKFKANIDMGKVLTPGTYVVKARVLGYKTRIVRNITITAQGATVTTNLPTGDIDGNLEVNTLDYDIFRSCWGAGGTDSAKCNSNASFRGMSDLDDNGTINEFDYNLFLRDFSAAQKEE